MANQYPRSSRSPFPWRVHPIWRGIGCAFLVIVPIISLGLADWLIAQIDEPLPEMLARPLNLPGIGLAENFLGRIFVAILLMVVLFLLLSVVGSILYSVLGGRKQEKQAEYIKKEPFKH